MPVPLAEPTSGFGSVVVAACATGTADSVPARAVAVANGRRTICSTPADAGATLMTETSLFHVAERKRRRGAAPEKRPTHILWIRSWHTVALDVSAR